MIAHGQRDRHAGLRGAEAASLEKESPTGLRWGISDQFVNVYQRETGDVSMIE